jgi:hypothetical protein
MCQYACLPAPKTVRSCTLWRFLRSMVEARAVRKAVTSSALTRPVVLPRASMRVSEPRMVDVVLSGMSNGLAGSGIEERELMVVFEVEVVAVEEKVDTEPLGLEDPVVGLEMELRVECGLSRLSPSKLGSPAASGGVMLMTLTAWPLQPLAGRKSVVEPSLRFSDIRSG